LDDQKLWTSFEKELEDVAMRDMRKLIFKSLNLCCEFYKMYAKSKGLRIREKNACKSRTDEHPTSKIFKCSTKGFLLQKYLDNSNRKRKSKKLTEVIAKPKFDSNASKMQVSGL